MDIVVNIHGAKTHLSWLLERVTAGERVTIARAGKPIVDLVPHLSRPVEFGGLSGELAYSDEAFGVDPMIHRMFYGEDDGGAA